MATPLTEAVEKLDAPQASDLMRVIDLQARWENLRIDPTERVADFSVSDLHGRQKAYEAFRVKLEAYTARYRATLLPEMTLNAPERVAAWCRVVAAIVRRAEGDCPVHAVAKAHRLADRIAARLKKEPVGRAPLEKIEDAVPALEAVAAWCDGLAAAPVEKAA